MHMPQGDVAVLRRIDQDTKRDQVVDLAYIGGCLESSRAIYRSRAPCQFLVKAIEMLDASRDISLHPDPGHLPAQYFADALNVGAPLLAFQLYNIAHPAILIRLKDLEG